MSRSRKHKTTFECGHRGFGRYCHECVRLEQVARKESKAKNRDGIRKSGKPQRKLDKDHFKPRRKSREQPQP